MYSFKRTLDFDSGQVGTTNHAQVKFQEATHLVCLGWFCGVIKRQKFSTRIFRTEFMSFLDKNKNWMSSHFWFSRS